MCGMEHKLWSVASQRHDVCIGTGYTEEQKDA